MVSWLQYIEHSDELPFTDASKKKKGVERRCLAMLSVFTKPCRPLVPNYVRFHLAFRYASLCISMLRLLLNYTVY